MNMLRISKRLVLLVVTILFFSVSISAGNAESPITITPNNDITQGMTDAEYIFTVTSGKGISPYAQHAYSIYVQNDPLHPDELEKLIAPEFNDTDDSAQTFTIRYTFSKKGTYVLIVTFMEPFSGKSTEERLIIHITNGKADCSNGHTWSTPAYTWAADSLQVTAERVCGECSAQESETVNATSAISTPAACTSQGVLTYTSAAFSNEAFEVQTKTVPIEATGHSPVIDAAVMPTCTETGLTEGSHCSVCAAILKAQQVVPTTAHTLISHAALEPTCTSAGNKAYWECSACGGHFKDPNGQEAYSEDEWILPMDPSAHAWSAPAYEWTDDNLSVKATRICTHDASHKETETVDSTPSVTKPATCEGKGETTYTASFTNTAFESQIKTVENINPLGHDYSEPTYTWAKDYSSATATRICTHDTNHMETETADSTSSVTKAATCEGKGETTFTAFFANPAFVTQTKAVENIDALGHDYSEPTYTWAKDYSSVTATRTCTHDANHMETETVHSASSVTKPATCEGKGETTYTVSFTNPAFVTQTQTVENIPALGHDYGEPTYSWAVDYSEVTATRICARNASHIETETAIATGTETVAVTCETNGTMTYTAAFANTAFAAQTKTVTLKALGHHPAAHLAQAASCTAEGNSAYWSCGSCGLFFSDEQCTTAIAKDSWIIPQTAHLLTAHDEAPADCTAAGNKAYWECSACGGHFKDPNGQEAYPEDGWILPMDPNAHAWGTPAYEWADDNLSVKAARVCTHDANHKETETVDSSPSVTKPATCEGKGETTFTATFTNGAFETQTKTVENINALGHNYGEPTYSWAKDYSSVTATRICIHDANHMETETVNSSPSVTKPATCEGKGETTYTVSFANPAFESQTKTVENINALGHDYGIPTYTWEADHSSVTATRICTRNTSHIETETALATGAETVAAACETDGTMTYSSAVFQNSAFAIQTKTVPIPRLGHAFSTPIYTWAPDYSTVTASRTCTRNSEHVEAETVATIPAVAKAATCEGKGKTAYTASFTNNAFESQTKTVENIDALGHDYGEPSYIWAKDYSEVTATRTCAHDANHMETETVHSTSSVTKPATCEGKGETTFTASFTNTACNCSVVG